MSQTKTIKKEDLKYELTYGIMGDKPDTTIELKYRELANEVIQEYNTKVLDINKRYNEEKEASNSSITSLLEQMKYNYTLHQEVKDAAIHYWVERETVPFADITEEQSNDYRIIKAMESIKYIGFKIVNNVFITSRQVGGNYMFFNNGEVLTANEVRILYHGGIPQRLLDTKPNH